MSPSPNTSNGSSVRPLLEVKDLKTHFPVKRGIFQRTVDHVRAVDGVSFDLGVGEARYKTTICDERDELVDTFVSVTAKGRLFAGVARARRSAKRWIKTQPRLLKLAHRAWGLLDKARGRSRTAEE